MVRHSIEAITPDISRLNLFSLNPQDFTEVRGDLGIRKSLMRLPQERLRLGILPKFVIHPAQTIEDRRIARRQRHRSLDQVGGLFISLGVIGQRVTQGVERGGMVGILSEDATQVVFHRCQGATGFVCHGSTV